MASSVSKQDEQNPACAVTSNPSRQDGAILPVPYFSLSRPSSRPINEQNYELCQS